MMRNALLSFILIFSLLAQAEPELGVEEGDLSSLLSEDEAKSKIEQIQIFEADSETAFKEINSLDSDLVTEVGKSIIGEASEKESQTEADPFSLEVSPSIEVVPEEEDLSSQLIGDPLREIPSDFLGSFADSDPIKTDTVSEAPASD